MATPPRKLILDNLKTTLEGITVANGFKTDVLTVQRVIRWRSVGAQEMPWIGFHLPRETYVLHPFNLIEVRAKGIIVAQVAATTDSERSEKICDIQDDIIGAIYADVTRSKNAVTTSLGTHADGETDEGDPDTIDSRGGSGTVIVPIEVHYERRGGLS